jgi:hypothetical protein
MRCRRVAVLYTTGPFAGLRQIIGTDEQLGGMIPKWLPMVQLLDHHAPIKLLGLTDRYALYTEVADIAEAT